jgi:hypothetical protein
MKFIPQTWQSFKFTVGIAVIVAAIFYGIFVTLLVLTLGDRCSGNSLVWNFLNTIISTTLGWYLAKASTVIDYVWGASHKTAPPPLGAPDEESVPADPKFLESHHD